MNKNNGGTNLTPARDVIGKWTGSPVFTDRAYECAYDGTMGAVPRMRFLSSGETGRNDHS